MAAILFPVFARARENARRASCQSNLKQIGLGIMQYTQNYDERFPMSRSEGTPLNMWNVDNTTAPGDANTGPAGTALMNELASRQAAMQ